MTDGTIVFETAKGVTLLECQGSRASGAYTGPQSATMTLTMTGCKFKPFGTSCTSQGYLSGGIVLAAMPVQIGIVEGGKKPVLGWTLSFGEAPADSSFECELGTLALAGSAIGRVTPADKQSTSLKLELKGKKGVQEPERFQAGGSTGVAFEGLGKPKPVSFDSTFSGSGAEAVELKALP
jgi:hypothetical protein